MTHPPFGGLAIRMNRLSWNQRTPLITTLLNGLLRDESIEQTTENPHPLVQASSLHLVGPYAHEMKQNHQACTFQLYQAKLLGNDLCRIHHVLTIVLVRVVKPLLDIPWKVSGVYQASSLVSSAH